MKKIVEETTLWTLYQDSTAYLGKMGLSSGMPIWVNFYEGRQWPAATENTKTMPRPVINIIKMICRNKKSGVLSSPVKLHYTTDNINADTEMFDRFAQYIVKELGQDDADSRGINDAVKKGTYAFHYYWDSEARGKNGTREGALRVETIDPLNVRVANPNEPDEQKQKWIMIVSREDLESVKEKADKDLIDNFAADTNDSSYQETEQEGTEYVTVLTRYFRKKGEVWFEKGTKSGLFNKAQPLTPYIEKTAEKPTEDNPETGLPDAPKAVEVEERKFERYPVVIGSWEERDKCIYGLGEVESLMPNQKAINYGVGLQLLKLQDEAWGTIIVADDALEGQVITNEVRQVLVDHSKLGNGIKKMQETPMTGTPMNIINGLTDATRMVTGSSEIMTGEAMGANMSGAAIATLQAQALKPIEELQQRFWRVKEKQGLVLAEFFKFFYEQKEFSYTEKDDQGKPKQVSATFSGRDYLNDDFRVVVEAGAAAAFSESGNIAMLEMLARNKMISAKSLIQMYPENALSNRKEILEVLELEEQGQMQQMSQQLQQQQAQLLKAAEILKAQSETVDKATILVTENQSLKQQVIAMGAEFSMKISEANRAIAQANADAVEFAKIIQASASQKQQQPKVNNA